MEQAWAKGAAGEERVGALLNQLQPMGWTIIHDLRMGSHGGNVDHLVIGSHGVFVIETKNVIGNVWVAGSVIQVSGFSKDYVAAVTARSLYVRERLLSTVGWDSLWVQGVLVFVTPSLTVKRRPSNISVTTDDNLIEVLQEPPRKHSAVEVEELAQAAKQRNTWR